MGRWTEQSSEQRSAQDAVQDVVRDVVQDVARAAGRSPGRRGARPADEAQVRRLRRAELLLQRQKAAERRRQRGFGLRLPSSKPLVFPDPPPAP